MLLFSGLSCDRFPLTDPRPEPIFYFHFKQKSTEKLDYFVNNSTYVADTVKIQYEGGGYNKFYYKILDNNYIFNVSAYRNTRIFYINYQNGDIDTLSKVWVSNKDNPTVVNMQKLTWYFNGQEIKVFDFQNNSALNDELYDKNSEYAPLNKAIVIDIFK